MVSSTGTKDLLQGDDNGGGEFLKQKIKSIYPEVPGKFLDLSCFPAKFRVWERDARRRAEGSQGASRSAEKSCRRCCIRQLRKIKALLKGQPARRTRSFTLWTPKRDLYEKTKLRTPESKFGAPCLRQMTPKCKDSERTHR
jgi:hypothetical protein